MPYFLLKEHLQPIFFQNIVKLLGLIFLQLFFKLPKSNLQKSDFSCKSVMPPNTHMALSWRTAECLCRGGGGDSEQPWEIRCHVSLTERGKIPF